MDPIDFESFIAQVEPDGLACLSALAIKSPQPIIELCRMIRLGVRKVHEILLRLQRFGYAGQSAPVDATNWHITSKAEVTLAVLFRHFLRLGSDPHQLVLQTGSDPDQITLAGSDPCPLEDVARGAQHALIHSDQIIDHSVFDFDHESEMNEAAQTVRDVAEVAKALDRNGIKDLPSKAGRPENNNREKLLADAWVTVERIDAAIERARNNPKRLSPNPIGLAVAELLRHRTEIDEWISAHQQQEPECSEEESDPEVKGFIEYSVRLSSAHEAYRIISKDNDATREQINQAYKAWQAVINEERS